MPAGISSGKRIPRIAFAGCLETLSSKESASVSKIQLFERSEFCIFETDADSCELRVSASETRNPGNPFSRAYPSELFFQSVPPGTPSQEKKPVKKEILQRRRKVL